MGTRDYVVEANAVRELAAVEAFSLESSLSVTHKQEGEVCAER
jgi:hypothetical protein